MCLTVVVLVWAFLPLTMCKSFVTMRRMYTQEHGTLKLNDSAQTSNTVRHQMAKMLTETYLRSKMSGLFRRQNALVIPYVPSKYTPFGVPDLYIAHPYYLGWIEAKRKGETPDVHQIEMAGWLAKNGAPVAFVTFLTCDRWDPEANVAVQLVLPRLAHKSASGQNPADQHSRCFETTPNTLLRYLQFKLTGE